MHVGKACNQNQPLCLFNQQLHEYLLATCYSAVCKILQRYLQTFSLWYYDSHPFGKYIDPNGKLEIPFKLCMKAQSFISDFHFQE